MFADTVLTVRGERSPFFGGEARAPQRTGDEYGAASGFMDLKNEDSDFFFKGYLDIEQLRANYAGRRRRAARTGRRLCRRLQPLCKSLCRPVSGRLQ